MSFPLTLAVYLVSMLSLIEKAVILDSELKVTPEYQLPEERNEALHLPHVSENELTRHYTALCKRIHGGTSWHASLIGEYLIEDFCRIPVEVEYASEFRTAIR